MTKLYIVDAFTKEPFRGNPAGVCIVQEFPEEGLMQSIAMELGFSNSAFVKKIGVDHYHIRWFTPHSEAPLCGHATVGSMHILVQDGYVKEKAEVKFESLSGQLLVSKSGSWYNLNFPSYQVEPKNFTKQLETVVNIPPIFTGFSQNCYFMEFENESTLLALQPNLEALKEIDCRALIATARGTTYDFHSRYFAPKVGINEDPVCASAHCRLIPYWAAKLNKNEMVAYQSSQRGGIIKCKNLTNRVLISGEAVTVMNVELNYNTLKGLKYVAYLNFLRV